MGSLTRRGSTSAYARWSRRTSASSTTASPSATIREASCTGTSWDRRTSTTPARTSDPASLALTPFGGGVLGPADLEDLRDERDGDGPVGREADRPLARQIGRQLRPARLDHRLARREQAVVRFERVV